MSLTIAVTLTCHNRRDKTLACLAAVQAAQPAGVDLVLHLTDDGSTDGTAEAVRHLWPGASIIAGDGTLFWNGGMRRAIRSAITVDPDLYLWLNDDTILDADGLLRLLQAHREVAAGSPAIVVGSTRDPDTGVLTYGGVTRPDMTRPMRFELVEPRDVPMPCETLNANIALFPRDVLLSVGNLDAAFVHAMGDYDYGLRAGAEGCRVWVAPGTHGTCKRNPETDIEGLREAWRQLTGRKGLPPEEWWEFTRRWAGPYWPVWFISPYVRRFGSAVHRRVRTTADARHGPRTHPAQPTHRS